MYCRWGGRLHDGRHRGQQSLQFVSIVLIVKGRGRRGEGHRRLSSSLSRVGDNVGERGERVRNDDDCSREAGRRRQGGGGGGRDVFSLLSSFVVVIVEPHW